MQCDISRFAIRVLFYLIFFKLWFADKTVAFEGVWVKDKGP